MKKFIRISALVFLCLSTLFLLTGCDDSTVAKYIIANEAYTAVDTMEKAVPPESLKAGEPVYASVYFIESPKGMKYTVEWLLKDTQVNTEEKEMETDKCGVIVFELPGDTATAGQLTLRVLYKGKLLFDKEMPIK